MCHSLLDGNNLTGTIPSSICRLTRLSTLLLDTNYLYGKWTEASFSQPHSMLIFTNYLEGSIPECIGQLTQLFFLDMRNNSLTGSIPSSIGLLTRLKYLFLNINMLVGTIPDFGALTMVKTMLLDDNNLGGVIPASLGKMTDMRYLNLSSNYLNSSIPESLGLLTQLQSLVVFDNELTGTLPSVTSLTNLFHLDLSSNSGLCGDLPGSLIQGDTQRVKLSSCVDSTDVPSRRLLSQDSSFTSTFAHAFDLQSATPLRDVGGAALDPESAWTASSSASGVVQLVVGPSGSLGGALRITLTALYSTARSAWFTAFDVDGVSFAFHPGPMDVGEDDPSFGGVRGAVLPNIGIFANNNGESSRCSVAFYLANEADGATKDELPSKYATWGLNTFANLTFHVDADGHPSVPTDGEGLPFQRVPIHNGGSTPGCTRVTLEPGADLIFGRGFGEAADSFSEIGHIHFIALSPALR